MTTMLRRGAALLLLFTLLFVGTSASGAKGGELVGTININTATAEQLRVLPGVGPAKAKRILEMRRTRPFQRTWEIIRVKGIGPAFFRKHKERLKVDGPTDLAWVEVRKGGGSNSSR